MVIIGITGTIGAGKGTIVEWLMNVKGFAHFSVRAYLIKVIEARGLTVNRDSMVAVANELRRLHNPAFIVEELYNQAAAEGYNAIIESIRTPGEIDLLRTKQNFILLAVDADPLVRYNRIYLRQSETDNISFEIFTANEKREMSSTDPTAQNLAACIAAADVKLSNNGTVHELYTSLDEALKKFLH